MIPTKYGYRYDAPAPRRAPRLAPRPAHRAAMTGETARALNRHGMAYYQVTGFIDDRVTSGGHVNPVQSPAALAAEEDAEALEAFRVPR